MMTPNRRRRTGPLILVIIGVSIMLAGIGLHWWYEYRGLAHQLEWVPQLIGASIAFAGFYAMNPTRALGGGGFLVESGVKVLGIIRGNGRRSTDAMIVEPPSSIAHLPLDEDDIPPRAG